MIKAMIRAFKYPLEPNRRQEAVLARWLERCRVLYNVALEQRREWWRMGMGLSRYDQYKELTQLRASDPDLGQMPVEVSRSPLRQLDEAFRGFYRQVKRGETPGYPRFKGRGRFDSFGIGRGSVEGKKLRVPILGMVKFRKYREIQGEIRDVRLVLRAGRWHVSFFCEMGPAPGKPPIQNPVGLDLGLSHFVTLSDGTKVENPKFFRKGEDLLVRRQRRLSRKKRGSKGCARVRVLVQKAHDHVRNQRLDFARKLAAELYRNYDAVFHEGLNIRGLSRSVLAKSVQDAAWGLFLRTLTAKAGCAGRWAIGVNPWGTSTRCSGCGRDVPKKLSERFHRCHGCGLEMDRDENAARNILALGGSVAGVGGQSPVTGTADR